MQLMYIKSKDKQNKNCRQLLTIQSKKCSENSEKVSLKRKKTY